jgi:hypothetical protein
MKKFISILSLLVLFMPLISLAHPGHGETAGYSITHYFVEPVHVVISLSVLVAIVLYIRHLGRNKQPKENA